MWIGARLYELFECERPFLQGSTDEGTEDSHVCRSIQTALSVVQQRDICCRSPELSGLTPRTKPGCSRFEAKCRRRVVGRLRRLSKSTEGNLAQRKTVWRTATLRAAIPSTQRSVVQIHPPQPINATAEMQWRSPFYRTGAVRSACPSRGRAASTR
jgi:hypothetical protein